MYSALQCQKIMREDNIEKIPELILGILPGEEILPEEKKGIRIERILGLLDTQSRIPTHKPRNFREQIILVDSGGTALKEYIYFGNTWKYKKFDNT